MKQGNFATRLLMLVFFAAILVYLGVNIFGALVNPLQTTFVVEYKLEESVEADGLFVRDELALSSAYSVISLSRSNGEKVGFDQVLAKVFLDEASRNKSIELESLQLRLSQIQEVLYSGARDFNAAELESSIVKSLCRLNSHTANRDFLSAGEESAELQHLVLKRGHTYGEGGLLEGADLELEAQIAQLEADIQGTYIAIKASDSGIFSDTADGFEGLLNPDMLEELSPAELARLYESEPQAPAGAFGKLISGGSWYFAALVDENEAASLKNINTITLRPRKDSDESYKMTVERVGAPSEGRCVVILSSDRDMSKITASRKASAQLVYRTYKGLRVPKRAIRLDEKGNAGVYCVEGISAKFKKVEIIHETVDFYLVKSDPSSTANLWAGDEIVLSSKDIYDGKILSGLSD